MASGIVKKVTDKGYGFIERTGAADVFFHINDCDLRMPFDETLTGMRVEFDVSENNGRPRAVRVRPAA